MLKKNIEYPRVLIINVVKVKEKDPYNLLVRMQFSDWPKESLAQIHATGDSKGNGEYCGKYYQLQESDRFLGKLFKRLRSNVFEAVSIDTISERKKYTETKKITKALKSIKKTIADIFIKSGIWELVFKVRISKNMSDFIEAFKPDLIYCQGSLLGFIELPIKISDTFNIPICIQIVDDWPKGRYQQSPVKYLLRQSTKILIKKAKIRFAFGEKMQNELTSRYHVPFNITYHLDNPNRFINNKDNLTKEYKIIYTGGLGLRRYEAIQDLLYAVRLIDFLKDDIRIIIYSDGIPKDMPDELLHSSEIEYHPLPEHKMLPSTLVDASLLFLPESFNENRSLIEFSISTKAHLYMMSNRPVLVYGPSYSGTVDYADRDGWGLVVSERNISMLKDALIEIFTASTQVKEMLLRAKKCIKNNHDHEIGKKIFYNYIVDATKK
jgi:glycosyltransferase involved in cell wall biosynthesis